MIEVEVEDEAWLEALPDCEAVVVRAARAALSTAHPGESRDPGFFDESAPARTWVPASAGMSGFEITVLLTDDESVRALNAQYRGKDYATNVLSFPAPETAAPHLGDICLAFGVCEREAREQGKTIAAHLTHLTAHAVLHLLGYDHETEAEAEDMEGLERAILARLGLPDPYETDAQR